MTRDVIFKYPVKLWPEVTLLHLPQGATPVHVNVQVTGAQVWVRHTADRRAPQAVREFQVLATGAEFPSDARHVGTFTQGPYVWHLIETTPAPRPGGCA